MQNIESRDINSLITEYPQLYNHPDKSYTGAHYWMQLGGFEIGDRHYDIFKEFSENLLRTLTSDELKSFYIQQVKDKWGDLCVYYDFYDDRDRRFHDGVEEAIKIVSEKYRRANE